MVVYGGPDIVTDGLVLHLDAGNSKSYPGSGTSWFDLSGNNRHFTLENGPTFANRSISFAGGTAGQRAVLLNTGLGLVNLTIEMAVNIRSNNGGYDGLFSARQGTGNDYQSGLTIDLDSGSSSSVNRLNVEGTFNGLFNRDALASDIPFNIWFILAMTIDDVVENQYKIYVNGKLDYNNTYNGSTISLDNISVGQRFYGGAYQGNSCLDGSISYVRVYSKALSAAELFTNYNATKGRYGL